MAQESDEDRIRRKAHELWVAEGHPHGRDQDHWDQAKEIIAIEDSQATTLLPRNTGAQEPVEPSQSVENYGDVPNLTDQGEHPLTDISREPELTSPSRFINATGDTTGAVARPAEELTPGIDDPEIVTPPLNPAPITTKPAAAVKGKSESNGKKSASGNGKTAAKTTGKPDAGARKGRNPPSKGV